MPNPIVSVFKTIVMFVYIVKSVIGKCALSGLKKLFSRSTVGFRRPFMCSPEVLGSNIGLRMMLVRMVLMLWRRMLRERMMLQGRCRRRCRRRCPQWDGGGNGDGGNSGEGCDKIELHNN